MIEFSDTPIVSRFGPISRRGQSIMRPSKPSQTFAAMDDEPTPTPVVRHSKQIASQIPPSASLILQNGGRTQLQPVAVAPNGEIGYIAVADPGVPLMMPDGIPVQAESAADAVDAAAVFAESERMKKDLEILQLKISHLNTRRNIKSNAPAQISIGAHQAPPQAPLHLELASEVSLTYNLFLKISYKNTFILKISLAATD